MAFSTPINSNFSIYEPEAWVEQVLVNQFPMRPMVRNSVANVEGASIQGLVAAHNKKVNITRAVKTAESDVNDYTGSDYTIDEPNANEESLTVDQHNYLGFKIDKRDQAFALPQLVSQHFLPRLHSLIDKINTNVKTKARNFEAAFVDKNTDATVIDDGDLRFARQIQLERQLMDSNGMMAVIDPVAENDLTSLNIFHQADQRGNNQIQLSGAMARAFGYDFFLDNSGSDHTAATVTDAVVAGTASEGDTSITIDDGAAGAATVSLAEGDIVYFGTDDGVDDYYVVDSQTGTALVLKEPLRKDLADDATINPVDIASGDTGKEQFFYDNQALALVTAVMQSVDAPSGSGVRRASGFEPVNGINYTLTVEETKKGADVLIETLYGTHNFYEDRGVRYIRGNAAKA